MRRGSAWVAYLLIGCGAPVARAGTEETPTVPLSPAAAARLREALSDAPPSVSKSPRPGLRDDEWFAATDVLRRLEQWGVPKEGASPYGADPGPLGAARAAIAAAERGDVPALHAAFDGGGLVALDRLRQLGAWRTFAVGLASLERGGTWLEIAAPWHTAYACWGALPGGSDISWLGHDAWGQAAACDALRGTPIDPPRRASVVERIAYHVARLPDTHVRATADHDVRSELRRWLEVTRGAEPVPPGIAHAVALLRLGDAAVPALLLALSDRRATRCAWIAPNGMPIAWVLRVNEVAFTILEVMIGRTFWRRTPGDSVNHLYGSSAKFVEFLPAVQAWAADRASARRDRLRWAVAILATLLAVAVALDRRWERSPRDARPGPLRPPGRPLPPRPSGRLPR